MAKKKVDECNFELTQTDSQNNGEATHVSFDIKGKHVSFELKFKGNFRKLVQEKILRKNYLNENPQSLEQYLKILIKNAINNTKKS